MSNFLALFCSGQGLLMHLRFHNLTFQSRWCSTPLQKATFLGGVIGGNLIGSMIGHEFFADKQLRRLKDAHEKNKIYKSETLRYHKEKL
jgi:hypothetical protein